MPEDQEHEQECPSNCKHNHRDGDVYPCDVCVRNKGNYKNLVNYYDKR